MSKRRIKGIIISDKMEKTVVVETEKVKKHPRYQKRYKVHKRYKAHDPREEYKIGDIVMIEECRPLSRQKRWRIIRKA